MDATVLPSILSHIMPNENLLRFETSPYLRQHADNPVHWAAWGKAALDEARTHNKPILLSIGYAACHWCHVMAHESFEDPEIADIMNAHFVCVKVDREERPDVDDLYMTALGLMGEQGGWPLTMFLDPDGQPFWGGTYFPKTPQHGRPGFGQMLTEIARAYREGHAQIETNAQALMAALRARAAPKPNPAEVPIDLANKAMRSLVGHLDPEHGGLGGAPQFPQPVLYQFLLDQALFDDDPVAQSAILHTLRQICRGGIYDHLGGGFARYTVDAAWLIPHFEKMLYDNALLIPLLCLAWKASGENLFRRRVEETLEWLARDMTLPQGGFAASRDADSDGREGAFYLWSDDELRHRLGAHYEAFASAYGCRPEGNFEGENILNRLDHDNDAEELNHREARRLLFNQRATRTPPALDDKLLTDWNGMMLSALVHAADLFSRPDWLVLAETHFVAICNHVDPDGSDTLNAGRRLVHSACGGKTMTIGLGEDYVQMITASLMLYAATNKPTYLQRAEAWFEQFQIDHWQDGGYTSAPRSATDILVHHQPIQDGATPSLNGAALHMLNLFYRISGKTLFWEQATALKDRFAGQLPTQYLQMPLFLQAHEWGAHFLTIIIVAPDLSHPDHLAFRQAATAACTRGMVISVTQEHAAHAAPHDPVFGKTCLNDQPTAYICPNTLCLAPTADIDSLKKTLQKLSY